MKQENNLALSLWHSSTQIADTLQSQQSRVISYTSVAGFFPMFFKLRSFPTLRWSRLFVRLFQNKGVFTMGGFLLKSQFQGQIWQRDEEEEELCEEFEAAFAFATAIGGSGQEVLLSATPPPQSLGWLVCVWASLRSDISTSLVEN